MVALTVKSARILLCVLIAIVLGPNLCDTVYAQNQGNQKVIITTTKSDKEGNETVEKMILTGEDASEAAIEKIVKQAKKDGKSIEVEMEYTFDTNGEEIQKMLKDQGQEAGDIELEIEIDEDGDVHKKVQKKEVRIIKLNISDEEIDIDALLKEHDITLDSNATKEIKIIKIKGDETTDIDALLKEHGIDKEGKQEVRIIKMKGDKNTQKGKKTKTKIIKIEKEEIIEIEEIDRVNVEDNLKKLGITLPAPTPPVANYVNSVTTSDKLVFLAGKGPKKEDGTYITGKVGRDLSVDEGYAAARRTGILQLGALKAAIGDLNRVKRIVKVLGMVNATADFTDHPEVINGFSDLMVEVFGERGKHARAAVGMYSLPRNIAVEVEMIVEIE